jgi:hypothetical protein
LAHLRVPFNSDYGSSKFLLGRLVEFAALGKLSQDFPCLALPYTVYAEYPELRIFALHPGVVRTTLSQETFDIENSNWTLDPVSLPAATMLTISAGKAEWLRGRFEHASSIIWKKSADLDTDIGPVNGT